MFCKQVRVKFDITHTHAHTHTTPHRGYGRFFTTNVDIRRFVRSRLIRRNRYVYFGCFRTVQNTVLCVPYMYLNFFFHVIHDGVTRPSTFEIICHGIDYAPNKWLDTSEFFFHPSRVCPVQLERPPPPTNSTVVVPTAVNCFTSVRS